MIRPTYGLVGRGRLATHLAHYLEQEGCAPIRWHRGMASTPDAAFAAPDTILLAISDDALQPFFEQHPFLRTHRVVHFSGSLSLDGIAGLHPLMTFGPHLYTLETYRSIPFIEERGGASFREVFPTLPNPSHTIAAAQKPLYHALCVLGGNFSTLLWAKALADFESRLGLPRESLLPFLQQVAINTAASGEQALTGSLARGDRGTVERDLRALEGDPFQPVFRTFVDVFTHREDAP